MDDGPSKSLDFEVRNSDTLWISSAIKAWWLIKFRGYRVITVRQVPRASAFGGVRYSRRWLMSTPRDSVRY